MKKIPTLYARDPLNRSRVMREVTPGCEWVLDGEGVATEKVDGTACLILDGVFYKRHRVKPGKVPPPVWFHHSINLSVQEGHGWVPVWEEDKWHLEAWDPGLPDGTYELVGPKVQGNPYGLDRHVLVRHGRGVLEEVPTDYDYLAIWLKAERLSEGVVWHHPDGRMAKIRRRDFGLEWPVRLAREEV